MTTGPLIGAPSSPLQREEPVNFYTCASSSGPPCVSPCHGSPRTSTADCCRAATSEAQPVCTSSRSRVAVVGTSRARTAGELSAPWTLSSPGYGCPRPPRHVRPAVMMTHALNLHRCTACSRLNWPPMPACASCLGTSFEIVPSKGEGKLWTFTIAHRNAADASGGGAICSRDCRPRRGAGFHSSLGTDRGLPT